MLYNEDFAITDTLNLTRIHASFPDADTFFPLFEPSQWQEMSSEYHEADERNAYPYSFIELRRR